jgi:hypothetical protein
VLESTEWGPIPKLAAQLAQTLPERAHWGNAVQREGGLWAAVMMSQGEPFWPRELLPTKPVPSARPARPRPPRRGLWSALARLFARWWTWRRGLESIPTRASPLTQPRTPDGAEVINTLIDCYTWLGQRNLQALTPYFAPLWKELPLPLLVSSPQGVVWSLAAYTFQTRGPQALIGLRPVLAADNLAATPGDCVAFHLHLISIVTSLRQTLRLPLCAVSERRRPGFLRSTEFIGSYLALVQRQGDRQVAEWLEGLNTLLAHSPLTRLLYLDLPHQSQQSSDRDKNFLLPLLRPEASAAEETDDKGWLELWLSHLARALLGACLSPPPSYEAWQLANQELAIIIAEDKARAAPREERRGVSLANKNIRDEQFLLARDAKARRERAEKKCKELRELMRQQYLQRWETVAVWLADFEYLKLRFLDLLVRQISLECAPRISAVWNRVKNETFKPPRDYFSWKSEDSGSGICFEAFEDALFGHRDEAERPSILPQPERERYRKILEGLLPAEPLDAAEISRRGGVFEVATKRLLKQFQLSGVVLPIPEERGYPPAELLADWLMTLMEPLSETRTTDVRSTVVG